MNTKHTAGLLGRNIKPINKYPILYAGRNTHIAQIITRGMSDEEAEANADFLVLAWNTHDELVAALESLLHSYHTHSMMPVDCFPNMWEATRVALAKAKSE